MRSIDIQNGCDCCEFTTPSACSIWQFWVALFTESWMCSPSPCYLHHICPILCCHTFNFITRLGIIFILFHSARSSLVYHHSNWILTHKHKKTAAMAKNDKHDAHCLPPAQFRMKTCTVYTNSIFIFHGSHFLLHLECKKYVNKLQNAVHSLSLSPQIFFFLFFFLSILYFHSFRFDKQRRRYESKKRHSNFAHSIHKRAQNRCP